MVGPELAAARTRLGLTVDQLADRTRIRPHVIESIEVDDFAPCGGDFYARGHLRTLARVLGVDAARCWRRTTSATPTPRSTPAGSSRPSSPPAPGPIRGTRGGPNWSVLVAAVMALVLAWSIARLVMDSPVELADKPVLNGSPSQRRPSVGPPVPGRCSTPASGGAHVVVRDGAGEIVFNGDLAFGETADGQGGPPVRVQSSDGGLRSPSTARTAARSAPTGSRRRRTPSPPRRARSPPNRAPVDRDSGSRSAPTRHFDGRPGCHTRRIMTTDAAPRRDRCSRWRW